MKNNDGMAVVDLSFSPDCKAKYRWRYKSIEKKELSGDGEIFEQYGTADKPNFVTSLGSVVTINTGPLSAKWSCHDEKSGWIYQDIKLGVYVVKNKKYSDFRL